MSARSRVLLLNPPFGEPCVRDNYCSYTAKAGDLWSPIDLLVQSGHLSRAHDLRVVDAVAERLSADRCLALAEEFRPDAVLALTGTLSWELDEPLLRALRELHPEMRVVLSGDFLVSEAKSALDRYGFIDAILSDYAGDGLSRLLAGEPGPYDGLTTREAGGGRAPTAQGEFEYPLPRHDLFPSEGYRLSVLRDDRFATVVTSTGCNYKCRFCIDSILPIRLRKLSNVMEELAWLAARGIREIYFYDPHFTARPARARELCSLIRQSQLDLSFVLNAHVASLADGLPEELRAAGAHTVMLGLESGNDEVLARSAKCFTVEKAREAVRRCKAAGLRVLAYFLFGAPGETESQMRETVDFALSLPLDFASFNTYAPAVGTAWGAPFLATETAPRDRSALAATGEVARIRQEAIARFYGRPAYILDRLRDVRRPSDLGRMAAAALRLGMKAIR